MSTIAVPASDEFRTGDPPPLEVTGLSRAFGGLKAVDAVDLAVHRGEVVGLIGPNGAGKTTVINLISGLLAVTEGSVRVAGHDVTTARANVIARLGLARTFQTARLFPDLSVERNVEIAGMFAARPPDSSPAGRLRRFVGLADGRSRRETAEILERLGLSSLRRVPARMLSYGHQRRLEIARALALRPRVLLLDEPVAGMNDREAAIVADLLAELAAEDLAILLVEHNMRFVAEVAHRLYVVDHGGLIAEGSPGDVLTRPNVVEAYLGTSHADR